MKIYKNILIWLFAFVVVLFSSVYALEVIDQWHLDTINKDIYKAVGSEDIDENQSVFRQWAHLPVDDQKVNKAIIAADWETILQYDEWAFKTFKYIKNIVNYSLWFLWILALIYLMYHWFIIVTTNEENKHQDAMKSIKTASIAIAWIWISWFIVSFIYYVVRIVYKDVSILWQ